MDCEQPNINDKDFVFLYNNNDNCYYGAYFSNEDFEYYKTWQFKDKNWVLVNNNILEDCEDGLIEVDKEILDNMFKNDSINEER